MKMFILGTNVAYDTRMHPDSEQGYLFNIDIAKRKDIRIDSDSCHGRIFRAETHQTFLVRLKALSLPFRSSI